MFDHVSIGVADIAQSRKFYDAALKPLGYTRLSDGETSLGYGDKAVQLWLGATQTPVKADMESGLHFALSPRTVPRSMPSMPRRSRPAARTTASPACARLRPKYYAAFAIDPDGYRLEAHCGK